ncbi:RecX family transcriptional regulator [Brevibacillus dissolubilis]|uniref:RecX family transcriptional regulator n=1 Tax=Brevibacillus dissolubilis TaxID=1844116 RepID=UPI00111724D7|nr:RecX family transcriptional regulator [Brevibacillus dissolubilis]
MQTGTITSVHKDPKHKNRYLIYIEDELAFDVHEDIFIKYQLYKGTELDPNLFAEIILAEEQNKAYMQAINYLSYRPRTAFQTEKHLIEKGYTPELARSIRERCEEQGYINDATFAQKWVEERLRLRPRGSFALKQELMQKGISKKHIDQAIGNIEYEEELNAARQLLEGKLRRKTLPLDAKEEQKLLAMLQRKGFNLSIIQKLRSELRRGE